MHSHYRWVNSYTLTCQAQMKVYSPLQSLSSLAGVLVLVEEETRVYASQDLSSLLAEPQATAASDTANKTRHSFAGIESNSITCSLAQAAHVLPSIVEKSMQTETAYLMYLQVQRAIWHHGWMEAAKPL